MAISKKKPPIDSISDRGGRLSEAFEIVRRCFRAWEDIVDAVTTIIVDVVPGPGGGGGGPSSDLATREPLIFNANGPFRVDDNVDGFRPIHVGQDIVAVWLTRTTAGTSGQTILDLNRAPLGSTTFTSLYVTQGNRPRIAYNDTDLRIQCVLPDVVTLVAGDVLAVDTDEVETGSPRDWTLRVEVA